MGQTTWQSLQTLATGLGRRTSARNGERSGTPIKAREWRFPRVIQESYSLSGAKNHATL
jgi:hypothetical protein